MISISNLLLPNSTRIDTATLPAETTGSLANIPSALDHLTQDVGQDDKLSNIKTQTLMSDYSEAEQQASDLEKKHDHTSNAIIHNWS